MNHFVPESTGDSQPVSVKHNAFRQCVAIFVGVFGFVVQSAVSLAWQEAETTARSKIIFHTVESEFQAKPTKIRVLLPDVEKVDEDRTRRLVFVLPVEAGDGRRYGDGLDEVEKLGLHNKHRVICIAPTFSQLPWFADHPTDPQVRQESHLLKVVLPFIDERYTSKSETSSRYLFGFSKSGWGAWSLLLRNPELFARAAAWDAPMEMKRPQYGSQPIFGTQDNFLKYRVPNLLEQRTKELSSENRLVLTGYAGNFRKDHQAVHKMMEARGIQHDYRDGPQRKHRWDSDWLSEAFELLLAERSTTSNTKANE